MQTTRRNPPVNTLAVCSGECHLSADAASQWISRDVGASIALAAYVPHLGLGGLLRFAYPDSAADPELAEINPYLFADTAVPALLASVRERGGSNRELRLYAVGGSAVAERAFAASSGKANELALKKILWRENVWLTGEDLGGHLARSVWFEPATGRLIVRSETRRFAQSLPELRYAV